MEGGRIVLSGDAIALIENANVKGSILAVANLFQDMQ